MARLVAPGASPASTLSAVSKLMRQQSTWLWRAFDSCLTPNMEQCQPAQMVLIYVGLDDDWLCHHNAGKSTPRSIPMGYCINTTQCDGHNQRYSSTCSAGSSSQHMHSNCTADAAQQAHACHCAAQLGAASGTGSGWTLPGTQGPLGGWVRWYLPVLFCQGVARGGGIAGWHEGLFWEPRMVEHGCKSLPRRCKPYASGHCPWHGQLVGSC